ncbi:MAG: hypothetical protein ACC660_02980 [Acidimicrobiales bacterium]
MRRVATVFGILVLCLGRGTPDPEDAAQHGATCEDREGQNPTQTPPEQQRDNGPTAYQPHVALMTRWVIHGTTP